MKLLLLVYYFSFALPLLTYFFFKRKEKHPAVRVMLFYVLYCIFQELATLLLFKIFTSLNFIVPYLFALYTLVEFSFFALFYYFLFPKSHKAKEVTKLVWALFIVFGIIDFLVINPNQQFDSFASGIECLILILLCGYYLYYQVTHTLSTFVYRTFNFWVIVTFFMYISATFFLYLLTDNMGENSEFRSYYAMINFGANILKNLLLAYAFTRPFLKAPTEKKTRMSTVELGEELIFQQKM